jgi:hypothetical protein
MRTEVDPDNVNREFILLGSKKSAEEAFLILAQLKDGDLKVKDAVERNNALGKANAAMGLLLKSDMLQLTILREQEEHANQLRLQYRDSDRTNTTTKKDKDQ